MASRHLATPILPYLGSFSQDCAGGRPPTERQNAKGDVTHHKELTRSTFDPGVLDDPCGEAARPLAR